MGEKNGHGKVGRWDFFNAVNETSQTSRTYQ